METDMTGAAAQIQQSRSAVPGQFGLEQRKFSTLGVYGTAQVGRGLFTELFCTTWVWAALVMVSFLGFVWLTLTPSGASPLPHVDV